jgi:uncharacterized protein
MRFLIGLVALLLGSQGMVWALKDGEHRELTRGAPGTEAPSPFMSRPLPELKGVVSWKTLAQVEAVRQKDRFVPQFSGNVAALDRKEVKLQGFMLPLDMGDRQKRFLLAAMPPTCAFCLPGGPEQLVEVQARTAIRYGFEPIVVSGRFQVLRDDPMGLFYRLTDAVPVSR